MTKGDRWVLGLGIAGAYALGAASGVLAFNGDSRLDEKVGDAALSASEAKADARLARETAVDECRALVESLRYELYSHIQNRPEAAHGYDPVARNREYDRELEAVDP